MRKQTTQRHLDMLMTSFGADIATLLSDQSVIEVMLNQDGKLWAESLTKGKFFTGKKIDSQTALNIIKLVAASRHCVVDAAHPEISCDLPEHGERFQGFLPPVSTTPIFSIRKKATRVFTLNDYVEKKALTKKQAEKLKKSILTKKNILIAGGTSSGKTTFANALLNELKDTKDRLIVLEDLPELQINAQDCVILKTTPEKTMRDLVKGSMRLRPDRIIIGEVRDGAALELLKAWNTGHPGGICTIHANSPEATISRLEDLIMEVVETVPKRLIHEAIDIIIFMERNEENRFIVQAISYLSEAESK